MFVDTADRRRREWKVVVVFFFQGGVEQMGVNQGGVSGRDDEERPRGESGR